MFGRSYRCGVQVAKPPEAGMFPLQSLNALQLAEQQQDARGRAGAGADCEHLQGGCAVDYLLANAHHRCLPMPQSAREEERVLADAAGILAGGQYEQA